MRSPWNIEEAREFCGSLEKALCPNYHVALGGSVLHKGMSRKDIDIFIFPHTTANSSLVEVKYLLEKFGMDLRVPNEKVQMGWRDKGSTDRKYLGVWVYGKRRVDVFFPWIQAVPS